MNPNGGLTVELTRSERNGKEGTRLASGEVTARKGWPELSSFSERVLMRSC